MGTELPVQRLRRRLGSDDDGADPTADDAADTGAAPDTVLSKWLPDTTEAQRPAWLNAIRADPGRAGVLALAAIGVLAVLITVFVVLRDRPAPVVSANLPPVQMVSSSVPTPEDASAPVVVSVVGLVHKPGLVTLSSGARIADALTAAGGALEGADLIGLNMARRVSDGEQIVVGIAAPAGQPTTMGSSISGPTGAATAAAEPVPSGGPSTPAGPLDLNTATVEHLDALPGIGPVTAQAIVAWRDSNGRFTSVDQLGDVDGIGPARLEKLRGLVRV
ncbi:ComEA family DNA-binding protein [Mycolicibacterium goodii]|uniref:ComEA family DNA-binding protein n=1 Tax=Mycolicibacterium goodii TaxID=134601 RepID=A0ABS6HFY4_MYCGD|nr:ComEA family DNA-binding protein [Mycolicibacterium goodii]OKH69990.1 membrane protein [Mycobacterium sp. SWH-M5]MBU8811117.1 ComEA family DNA-binding protein [Mycolicibacterium goodii]MBU8815056.1 ComEA family DNA-binding protein [Mycolicibacterium goodii]MBU8821592.1 ComEA family DNA-binding protein [Mycolicibacterium goodii]MBU8830043.1 ComEA family DNA-binding protein [Mycolicibacterium goodii]